MKLDRIVIAVDFSEHSIAAAQWVARVVLSLMYWPAADEHAEYQLVQRFVALGFAEQD